MRSYVRYIVSLTDKEMDGERLMRVFCTSADQLLPNQSFFTLFDVSINW